MAKSIRDIYGETLAALGGENENIVVLDADLSSSTRSKFFGKKYPDRFFNLGIAESDMVSCAAGLAAVGKIPFVNTFTSFLTTIGLIATRSQVCYGNLNVKFAGAYGGMSDALDGASHHALEDLAIMRSLPNMQLIVPSDPQSTRWATRWAAVHAGPVYLRLSRGEYLDLYPAGSDFQPGQGKIVREGTDCTVLAVGIMVHKALEAAEILQPEGISLQVVDLLWVKPIDRGLILSCAAKTGAIVCAEEHQIYGGVGSAAAEVLAGAGAGVPMEFVGVQDVFSESGSYDELMKAYGLDAEDVAEAVRRAQARK